MVGWLQGRSDTAPRLRHGLLLMLERCCCAGSVSKVLRRSAWLVGIVCCGLALPKQRPRRCPSPQLSSSHRCGGSTGPLTYLPACLSLPATPPCWLLPCYWLAVTVQLAANVMLGLQ